MAAAICEERARHWFNTAGSSDEIGRSIPVTTLQTQIGFRTSELWYDLWTSAVSSAITFVRLRGIRYVECRGGHEAEVGFVWWLACGLALASPCRMFALAMVCVFPNAPGVRSSSIPHFFFQTLVEWRALRGVRNCCYFENIVSSCIDIHEFSYLGCAFVGLDIVGFGANLICTWQRRLFGYRWVAVAEPTDTRLALLTVFNAGCS
mmetsp:Transcript_41149/g.88832  ORF Transcript_41149/g.88832 Transcript_41149/m.88832 type:complete len:206 (-) Transcript_41149:57-674(-)